MKKYLQMPFSTRKYMLSKDFELFYYSDKNIIPLKEHSHNYYEFYFFLGGNISINILGKLFYPAKGDMVILPPGVKHQVNLLDTTTYYQRFVFWISAEFAKDLGHISHDYTYLLKHVKDSHQYVYHFDIVEFNTIQSKLFLLSEEIHFNRFGKAAKISLAVNDLILHLNRSIYETLHPKIQVKEQGLYENLIEYIEQHLDEELSLEHLAKYFFVNKYHIAHLFKNNHGLSVHQYIIKKRLAVCRDALLSNEEITDICLLCGFNDYSAFYRSFKKEYGMSPREYKRQFLQKGSE